MVVGDLLEPADIDRVANGCRRVYFGKSVSAGYLEATVIMATVARQVGLDALVNMSEYLTKHLVTMAALNRAGDYDRIADGVERVTGRPAMSVREFVSRHIDEFGGPRT